jgi:hypothetical protein
MRRPDSGRGLAGAGARRGARHGLQALLVDQDELTKAVRGEELSFAAAAIRMRLNSRGLRKAIDGGIIAGVKAGSKTVPASVAEAKGKVEVARYGLFRLSAAYGPTCS